MAIFLIRIIHNLLSIILLPSCRYMPSCSSYVQEAIRRHGLARGSALAVWRLLRCQPLCKGGFDPVP